MNLPKEFISQGVTEQDILLQNSNTYQPGFMQIHLMFSYPGSFDKLTDIHEQGSFLHEYVHYLQNIATPWGLYSSMLIYEDMVNTFAYIQQASEPLKLPLGLNLSETSKRKNAIVENGNGTNPFVQREFYGSLKIDRSKQIIWHRRHETIGNTPYPTIELEIPFLDGTKKIKLGAYIIKESMAAMYQMQLDSSAKHDGYDVPYNVIKILAEQHFPNIAMDDKKLISICYISLFSLSPGQTLLDQLDFANRNPEFSGVNLFGEFVNKSTILINQKVKVSVVDFFEDLADKFEIVMSKCLQTSLDYIHEALSRVRLSNGTVPIISALYAPKFDKSTVQTLIDYAGIPYIYTNNGEFFHPESIKEKGKESNDLIALIGMYAIYNYIVHPNQIRCCPLRYMCLNTTFEKDECFDAPWEGHECTMTIMGRSIGIKKGQLVWK